MIIDAHVHLMEPGKGGTAYSYLRKVGGAWSPEQTWDAARIVGLLDECGYDKAILFPSAAFFPNVDYRFYNDYLAYEVHKFPDRLWGFGCLDLKGDPHASLEVPRIVEDLGLMGLKFVQWLQGYPANSSWLKPVYEQASRYHLPILFHSGSPPYTQPFQIVEWADEFPDVQFILGHFGKLVWLDAVRAAMQYPNVYLETSGAQVSDIEIAVELLGEERIVYGTDLPVGGAGAGKWDVAKLRSARISERAKERIFSENILAILSRVRRG